MQKYKIQFEIDHNSTNFQERNHARGQQVDVTRHFVLPRHPVFVMLIS